MPVPWLRIVDVLLGVTDLARVRLPRPAAPDSEQQLTPGSPALGHLETRLAGVVVAALREAFDRDTRRLELEREQMDAERRRAERALRLELLRQTGEREIGRLRLVAGIAIVSWIGTLLLVSRAAAGSPSVRAAFGSGWGLLLLALALALSAQSAVGAALDRANAENDAAPYVRIESGLPGMLAPWLIVSGLAVAGLAVLMV